MNILLLLSAIAGILLLVGTMLLLWFRRIYIDAQTGEPTVIEIPLIGKFRTHAPAFALIIVGAILVIYPIYNAPKQDSITVEGAVNAGRKPVTVFVVSDPNQATLHDVGPFHMSVPLIKGANYRVKFIVDGEIVADREARPDQKGVYKVKDWDYRPQLKPTVNPGKEITDEEVRRLGIN